MKLLVTGATGYVGGRLVRSLIDAGHEVRCMVRTPAKALAYEWAEQAEVVRGDVLDSDSIDRAIAGCDAAYYLVHSMGSTTDFGPTEATGAENFRQAAERANVRRIVYLGGIVRGEKLSHHLASRKRVGEILAAGAIAVTEFRAAIVIGSGSISFEMLRYLTEVLPIMTTPSWVRTKCQPIAIRDVLEYLVKALEQDDSANRVIEIGGADVLTYQEMMQIYAEEAGLARRTIIRVPVLSPGLSSLWIGLVTPLPSAVARPLIDSLEHEVVVIDDTAQTLFDHRPIGYRHAVTLALARIQNSEVVTRWSDAGYSPADAIPGDPDWAGGTVFSEKRTAESTATTDDLYWAVSRIGGDVGYYAVDWAWKIRGLLDKLVGGPGLRRGRRHATNLRPGEALDFWRVVDVDPGSSLELAAEMRVPGEAWLRFEVTATDTGSSLNQTAYFAPRGLLGRVYWLVMFPFHAAIFAGMARSITAAAERRGESAA